RAMTTTGIVFSIFNVLLSITFIILTAPVVNDRIEMQKKIADQVKKIPGLEESVLKADRDRVGRLDSIDRERAATVDVITTGRNRLGTFQARSFEYRDQANNDRDVLATLELSIGNVKSETEARLDESESLVKSNGELQASVSRLEDNVTDLKARLANATMLLADTLTAIADHNESLIELRQEIDDKGKAGGGEAKVARAD
ncbi:MAG: hypothetical protein ACRC1K_26630, partial [Planctomycetia bacterium]